AGIKRLRSRLGGGLGLAWGCRARAGLRFGSDLEFGFGLVGFQFVQHLLGPAFIGLEGFFIVQVLELGGAMGVLVQFLEAVAELVIGNQAAGVVAFFFIFFRVVLEQELLVILQSGRLLWEGGRLRAGRREIEIGGWRLVLLVGLCQSGLFVGFGLGEDGVQFCFGLGQGLLIHLLIGLQLLIQAEIPQSLFQFLIFFQQAVEAEVLVVLGEFFLCRIRFRMLSQGGFQFRKQFRLRCFSRMALKRLCLVRLWTGVGLWLEGCGSRGLGRGHGLAGYRLGRWCCRRGRQGGGRSAGLCPGRRGRSVSGRRLGGRVRRDRKSVV